jgi:tRNA(Ile)-lysidine synthase TilS/MesJ
MSITSNKYPPVTVVTSHFTRTLESEGDERLIDLLNRHQVPWSAISVYVVPFGGDPVLRPCLDLKLSQFENVSEIRLYFNRNVNPFLFSLSNFKYLESQNSGSQATEYFYQQLDNESSSSNTFLKKLDPEECRSVIAARVNDAIRFTIPPGTHLVVGVSGGGDSNSLLHGLTQIKDYGLVIHPIILKGIPEWDLGVPRAQKLCDDYGLDLTVIEENEVKSLLGIPKDSMPLIDRFLNEFKGDDFEFVGTLLIRLALIKHAQSIGSSYIATGLNLEDVLCENMFRISSGMKPASCPKRAIGNISLVFPLWLCPKRIIDGCFPKFSLENYDVRYPCHSLGRNLYYSVIYSMQSQFPGFIEQMARGLSELSLSNPVNYLFDEQLGFHVERPISPELRQKFQNLINANG